MSIEEALRICFGRFESPQHRNTALFFNYLIITLAIVDLIEVKLCAARNLWMLTLQILLALRIDFRIR